MADLGTSVSLQGLAEPNSKDNPVFIKDDTEKDLIKRLDAQKAAKDKEDAAFQDSLYKIMSVNAKILPGRVEGYQRAASNVVQSAINARRKGGNAFLNPEVMAALVDLEKKKNLYEEEYRLVNKTSDIMNNPISAGEYNDETVGLISDAKSGNGSLGDSEVITQEMINKGRTYQGFRKPVERQRWLSMYVPRQGEVSDIEVKNPDGTRTTTKVKGSDIFNSEDGRSLMKERYKKVLLSDSNYARGYLSEAKEVIDAMGFSDPVFKDRINSMTPAELNDMVMDAAATQMLEDASNANKYEKGIREKLPPTLYNSYTFNRGDSGMYQNIGGNFQGVKRTSFTDSEIDSDFEKHQEVAYRNYIKKNNLPDSRESREKFKIALGRVSKNNPKMTIGEWNKEQFKLKRNGLLSGGDVFEITFVPKVKGGFVANVGEKNLLVEPMSYLVGKDGNIKEISVYQIDESTKEKKDNKIYRIDANGANLSNFTTKYGGALIEGTEKVSGVKLNTGGTVATVASEKVGVKNSSANGVKTVNTFEEYVSMFEGERKRKATDSELKQLREKFNKKANGGQ